MVLFLNNTKLTGFVQPTKASSGDAIEDTIREESTAGVLCKYGTIQKPGFRFIDL